MPRRTSPDLRRDWKVPLPARLAGAVEHELLDPLTKKPRYGERSKLISALLEQWLADHRARRIEPLMAEELPSRDIWPRSATA